jgi:hypothetical protein
MSPKEECEELMNQILPFAANQLEKRGEFFPVGAVMTTDRKIALSAFHGGDEMPKSQDVIDNLEKAHKVQADSGEIAASIIVYDSKIAINEIAEDAVVVSLEHIDNYCAKVAFPYKKKKKWFKNKVEFYEPIAFEGSKKIF